MILVDTSAWVDFLRNSGSLVHRRLTAAVASQEQIGVLDVVRLELLAGAADEARATDLNRFLARFEPVPLLSPADHEVAASLYRAARCGGNTVRSLIDCAVAAAALRLDVPVLARDRDYEVLAGASSLRLLAAG